MKDLEVAWLAGILEGEGSFGLHQNGAGTTRLGIQLNMTDKDIVERVADLLGGQSVYTLKPREGRKQAYSTFLTGYAAADMMKLLLPFMGERRKEQIRSALERWDNRIGRHLRDRRKRPECHPDRPHEAKGLCAKCYRRKQHLPRDPRRRVGPLQRDWIFI